MELTREIAIVVAHDYNGVIGVDRGIPWKIHQDMVRFREITIGHTVIMGRTTWESLKRPALPDRYNIVLTSDPSILAVKAPGVVCAYSVTEAVREGLKKCSNIYLIGGTQVYREGIRFCDTVYRTLVKTREDYSDKCVAYFGVDLHRDTWRLESEDDRGDFIFQTFKRLL